MCVYIRTYVCNDSGSYFRLSIVFAVQSLLKLESRHIGYFETQLEAIAPLFDSSFLMILC